MARKAIIFLCIITVFIFFAPAMKAARMVIHNAKYAGSGVNSVKSAKNTKYDTQDDTTDKTDEETEDMSCCGDPTSTGTDPVDNSNDDTSCASKDDVHRDGGSNNEPECVYGTYKCADSHSIYGCNQIGTWVFFEDCGNIGKFCGIAPSCGYDPYGEPIPYCCKP